MADTRLSVCERCVARNIQIQIQIQLSVRGFPGNSQGRERKQRNFTAYPRHLIRASATDCFRWPLTLFEARNEP